MEFAAWTDWFWWHVARGNLTMNEASERLALELFIQRTYGLNDTLLP